MAQPNQPDLIDRSDQNSVASRDDETENHVQRTVRAGERGAHSMKFMVSAFAVSFALASIPQALAQSCTDVLSAAYNTTFTKGSSQAYAAAKSAICSRQQGSNSDNSSIGIDIPAYGNLNAGRNISGQELSAWCRSDENVSFLDQKFELAIANVHDNVINAWNNCMTQPGAHASLGYTDDPSKVLLITKYIPNSTTEPTTTPVDKVLRDNLTCEGLQDTDWSLGNQKSFPCRRDPYKTSSVSINLSVVNSPYPLTMPAIPRPLVPTYNLTGNQNLGDGIVQIQQDKTRITWSYNNPTFAHSFEGAYFNDTQATGLQRRITRANNCIVIMRIQITAFGTRNFCHDGSIDGSSPSTCDLGSNWPGEHICHTY
jgi:hypothetical protein